MGTELEHGPRGAVPGSMKSSNVRNRNGTTLTLPGRTAANARGVNTAQHLPKRYLASAMLDDPRGGTRQDAPF